MNEQTQGRDPGTSRVRRAAVVAAFMIMGVLLGVAVAALQSTRYESTARVLVGPIGGDRETLDAAGLLSTTYADLVTSRASVVRVAEALSVAIDPDDVSAVPDARSRVISIVVIDDDPDNALTIANALAADLITVVSDARIDDPAVTPVAGTEAGQVTLLDDASVAEPVRNPTALIVVGMGLLGIVGGVFADRLLPSFRQRVDPGFVESLGLPVVEVQQPGDTGRLTDDEWDLVAAQLVHECGATGPFRSVAYLPVDEGDDTASLFLHLAAAEARAGGPVTVVDADIDRPLLAERFGDLVPESRRQSADGLQGRIVVPHRAAGGDPILHGVPLRLVVPPAADSDLPARGRLQRIADVLPAGSLLEVLCPAAGTAPAAIASSLVVDHVVLVVRTGRSAKRRVVETLAALDSVGTRPSVVLQLDKGYSPDSVELHLGAAGLDEAPAAPAAPGSDRRQQYRTTVDLSAG